MGPSLSTKVPFDTDYRFIVSGNYLVFYKADDEYVSIYRILYGRRDYLIPKSTSNIFSLNVNDIIGN